jgi:hypothetical protein
VSGKSGTGVGTGRSGKTAVCKGGPGKNDRKSRKILALVGLTDILFHISTSFGRAVSLLLREIVMVSSVSEELDFIQELRLRRWAREHYVPAGQRESSWHPVILDEMNKKDVEVEEPVPLSTYA